MWLTGGGILVIFTEVKKIGVEWEISNHTDKNQGFSTRNWMPISLWQNIFYIGWAGYVCLLCIIIWKILQDSLNTAAA